MRVALIDPSLFTLPYDQMLAGGLSHAGHDVTLYGRRPGKDDSTLRGVRLEPCFYRVANSAAVAALPNKLRLAVKGLDHIASMRALRRRLRAAKPDVIHFQWVPLPVVDHRLLPSFRAIAPLVLTVHDTNPFNGDPSARLQARGMMDCFRQFDRLIVHTEQGHARLLAQGVPADRLSVVPHGPMADPASRPAPDTMQGELTFLLFGKIKPYKGADVLVEAFAALPPELKAQARVRIVGKAYMELEPLQRQIQRLGVSDRVSLEPRFVTDEEIYTLFGPNVVAAFPYREIDTSGVLMQALSRARPVLASAIGCFAELLRDGVQGHFAAPDDVPAFTAAMAHFIRDRPFAAAASARALAVSDDDVMGWNDIAGITTGLYRQAIEGDAPPAPAQPVRAATREKVPVTAD